MLITDLTGEQCNYEFDPKLIDACIDERYCHFHYPRMEMYLHMNEHLSVKNGTIPFYHIFSSKFKFIKQVPIFLVTKQQCLKTFTVGYFGYKVNVTVPLDVLPNNVPETPTNDENAYEDIDPYKGERNKENAITSCIDLWGLYTREYPTGRWYGIDESRPRIFIWVDKIYDYVFKDNHKYRVLVTQVILHELAHAMMDINLPLAMYHIAKNQFNKTFYTLKEESLANAISLTLIKPHVSDKDWDFIISVVKQQPFQYALGLDYLDTDGRIIERSIGDWMHLKKRGYYSPSVAKEWIKYVYGPRPLDCKQLELLDRGMWYPRGLYRYPANIGDFYDEDSVAVKVIKDYIANHPSITRAELHTAFPDTINDDFEAIIDYPEQTEFHDKNDPNTQSIDSDKVFNCIDGEIAVCDSWYPFSKFIANAKLLNIDIESFQ